MLRFRERVLEPFFAEAKISIRSYYDRKDLKRTTPRKALGYDSVDLIIIDLARGLRKQPQIFDTFGYLYYCHQREDVQQNLGRIDGGTEPHKRDTILSYEKDAIKYIHDETNRNSKIRKKIIDAIKVEYERSKNQ